MKKYKTIRVTEETYQELMEYRAEVEAINKRRLSIDDAIGLIFVELHGGEYEAASEKLRSSGYQPSAK